MPTLFLVLGIFSYLYSPLLDHWLGNEVYARPHTHVHVSKDTISQFSLHHEPDLSGNSVEQEQHEHEEGVLCLLDIEALLALLLAFNIAIQAQLVQQLPLVFELVPFYFPVSIIYLSSLDPLQQSKHKSRSNMFRLQPLLVRGLSGFV
jgi:hypothetical protein